MKNPNLIYIILLISIFSCNSKSAKENTIDKIKNETTIISELKETELIIGERIDGPANIRNKPNGNILFELNDNALVQVTSKPENDWYKVLINADINYNEFPMDSILKGRPIIVNNDTIGKIIQSHSVNSDQSIDFACAVLYGYTHKNNIKPETIIETVFQKNLAENGRDYSEWKEFIESFQLDNNLVDYESFESYYNYESIIEDPSPGFRIVLLFKEGRLIGVIHSREFQIASTNTHNLNRNYYVTFFNDYPEKEQLKFVKYINELIQWAD